MSQTFVIHMFTRQPREDRTRVGTSAGSDATISALLALSARLASAGGRPRRATRAGDPAWFSKSRLSVSRRGSRLRELACARGQDQGQG